MNDRLPLEGVFPMHCSANVGDDGDVAIFFGLSGTGKTTLSADPERQLIGDDEHGWGDTGVFNFEGGCYAKVIRLSAEAEPEIYKTTRTFGTILENVVVDERGSSTSTTTRRPRTRAPPTSSSRSRTRCRRKRAGHPANVVFLTADAFGILPPIARLSDAQARYYFLSGFTAKLAGTEIGVTEPQPTFSTCFGAPFLPQPPAVYSQACSARSSPSTGRPSGSSTPAGPAARSARATGCRSRRRARCPRGALRPARRRSSSAPTRSSASRCRSRCPASTVAARPALDLARPGGLRRQGAELAAMFRANFEKFEDVDPEVAAAGP